MNRIAVSAVPKNVVHRETEPNAISSADTQAVAAKLTTTSAAHRAKSIRLANLLIGRARYFEAAWPLCLFRSASASVCASRRRPESLSSRPERGGADKARST